MWASGDRIAALGHSRIDRIGGDSYDESLTFFATFTDQGFQKGGCCKKLDLYAHFDFIFKLIESLSSIHLKKEHFKTTRIIQTIICQQISKHMTFSINCIGSRKNTF